MSGPSPGRQEAGAPCTGELLLIWPAEGFSAADVGKFTHYFSDSAFS